MSSYMYFSIRKGEGEFVPLLTQSRSFPIYQAFREYAPYGEIEELTEDILSRILEDLNEQIVSAEKSIEEYKELEEIIKGMNKPLKEIIDKWYEIKNEISEYEELIREYKDALGFVHTLLRFTYENEYEEDESKITHLYFGVDSGFGDEDEEEE